jgi:hypothetical protein
MGPSYKVTGPARDCDYAALASITGIRPVNM